MKLRDSTINIHEQKKYNIRIIVAEVFSFEK